VPERSHLSIGEVLSLLREEFPDVTISKIRFLESQGLVDPERTPSGYRKFYDHDVERLRWILRQQRENFLPLKVIRGRLSEQGELLDDETEVEDADADDSDRDRLFSGSTGSLGGDTRIGASAEPAVAMSPSNAAPEPASVANRPLAATSSHPAAAGRRAAIRTAERPEPEPSQATNNVPAAASEPGPAPASRAPASRAPASPAPPSPAPAPPAAAPLSQDSDSYSAEELAASSGSTVLMVRELEQFGLISPHAVVAGTPYFDSTALAVAKAAAGFARHGVEARHLRSWRNSVDREAGLFEQVVIPLLRQRNPEARRRAAATLAELSGLGADLRHALIDQAVRQIH
jgi:DNA-binding transcriptional MerR regulator